MCSIANPSLPKYVVDLTYLVVHSVPALSDHPAVHTREGALEERLETTIKCIKALEWRIASKDDDMVAKVTQVDCIEQRFQIAKEWASLMLATSLEHSTRLCSTKAACLSAEVALPSGKSQLQVVCPSESSLQKALRQLWTDKICLVEQCELEARCESHTCGLLDSESKTS